MKRCIKCGETKPTDDFPKDRSRKDGLNNKCRACCLKQWQEWRAKNLERSQQYHREYRKANPDKVKAWAATHAKPAPGKPAEYSKAWRERNAEQVRQANSAWRDANRDKISAVGANWRKKYPDRHRQRSARYKARKRENTVERVDYEAIIERDKRICHLCREIVDLTLPSDHPMSRSFDHVIPLARGGPHSMGNVKLSHLRCNFRKGVREPYG